MSTDRLATICTSEKSTCSWVALHLVSQEDGNIELCVVLAMAACHASDPTDLQRHGSTLRGTG